MFYKKSSKRWTWSIDGRVKNEIDFILFPVKDKQMIINVEVISSLKFFSDHRMVRAALKLSIKFRIRKKSNFKRFQVQREDLRKIKVFNENMSAGIVQQSEFENVQSRYDAFQSLTQNSGEIFDSKRQSHLKISVATRLLIDEREELRKVRYNNEHFKNLFLAKRLKVKSQIRKDIRDYDAKLVEDAISRNMNLKTAKEGIAIGKSWINSLIGTDGLEKFDRQQIVDVAAEFYKGLYSSTLTVAESIAVEPL